MAAPASSSASSAAAFSPDLQAAARGRFAHVDACPFQGPRIFFENAGGALTLKSVVETSARFAAIPDNQGRDNPASGALMEIIAKAKDDMAAFFNPPPDGRFMVGESGSELLFRLIRSAIAASPPGDVLGCTVEHPASRSAARRWSDVLGRRYILVPHDDAIGAVAPEAYAAHVTPETRVATILHTSPVTGIGMDVAGIAAAVRAVAPEAFIIVDGIQHACHGDIDIAAYGVDGYVVSPYKVFSRHGYGAAWASERLTAAPHENLIGGPEDAWEMGTRDTGAYATFSDVVQYFDWLGTQVGGPQDDRRARLRAAAAAIHAHERALCDAALFGVGNHTGLADTLGAHVIGGVDNPNREGLVSFWADGVPAADIVSALNAHGIRTHTRKADHYSANILAPLQQESCVRVSFCHYNTLDEVGAFLSALHDVLAELRG